ncbi:MAG: phosphoribosyltransferase [Opitutales bacterium]
MIVRFQNRNEAGRLLAEKLAGYANRTDVIVLALPRGGVPVGQVVARALGVPFDVLVVRKLGVPGNEELAMGAIAAGGVRVLNRHVLDNWELTGTDVKEAVEAGQAELLRRERLYRHGRPMPDLHNRTVILVDDGIATGSTMRAAVAVLHELRAGRIIVASPVTARESYLELRNLVSEFVTLGMPKNFDAVGQFYVDFRQTTDAEVRQLLEQEPHVLHAE